ncbi:syntaxin-5-like [Actinia tenebrosa]|uniref:Syntaxin-5-like n=1 Tax=Actinia tenebrosa TaxID=6105 RepID=A0A6P8I113_ACTTE|nr:syntaxin-5-like [Actinia tenebrosa]
MTTRRRRTRSSGEDQEHNSTTVTFSSTRNADNSALDMTSCRERTPEFLSAVKSIKTRQGSPFTNQKLQGMNGVHHQKSQFFVIAKHIGKDISNTFHKLEKLAILAKKKSLFDDRPMEIQELTYIIKQDINGLNQQIAQLQELVKSKSHTEGKHQQTHSNTVVLTLQSKLATMSKDFKSVLEVRTENLKQQKERRDQFSQGGVSESITTASMPGTSVLQRSNARGNGVMKGGADHVAIDMGGSEHSPLMNEMNQMQAFEEQDTYISSRANAMQSIESTIVELGSIFSQLANMVKEQEEQIQRIDANVETTEMNVEAAHGEILKYFQSVSSNRWLIIKIFLVLIIFFVIFVVFMG